MLRRVPFQPCHHLHYLAVPQIVRQQDPCFCRTLLLDWQGQPVLLQALLHLLDNPTLFSSGCSARQYRRSESASRYAGKTLFLPRADMSQRCPVQDYCALSYPLLS